MVAIAALIHSTSITVSEWSLFVLGACASGRWVVGYIYFTEFLTDEATKRYGCLVNASAAVPIIMGAFTF